jgi:hypothetical protein
LDYLFIEYLGVELSEAIFHYKFVAILLLFRFGYLFFFRKHFKLIKKRVPRPSSDATWFLPVYVWGIESIMYMNRWVNSQEYSGGIKYLMNKFIEQFYISTIILIVVTGLCYLQEYLAHRVGMGVRESQATIPLSVLFSILGVWFIWIVYYSIMDIPILH